MRSLIFCLAFFLAVPAVAEDWALWQAYAAKFVQKDGRTIDYAADDKSTSEGQSYTLFFALVANDRATFDRVLDWTQNNLAQGDLSARLPAWSWGKHQGKWGVIDANSASDADLWLAYTLLEAGRLWREARYQALGELLLARIDREEVAELPGLGPMLLPGSKGFQFDDKTWRLNPSYMPFMILRRFAAEEPEWNRIALNSLSLIRASSPHRLVPDWAAYRSARGFVADPVGNDAGGYDAIRVYLWAGMLSGEDKFKPSLMQVLTGMRDAVKRKLVPPEVVHVRSGRTEGTGPVGYSAALLPYLDSLGEGGLTRIQRERVEANRMGSLIGANPRYYDQVLSMFGEGWMEGRFHFDAAGQCEPAWKR